jgi:ribonuclease J
MKNREANLKMVKENEVLNFGPNKVETFGLTASSPKSLGFALHTEDGTIVFAGDYLIDGQETSYFSTDFSRLNKISEKGVLALIADTEFASRMSYTVPNHKIEKYISGPFKERKLRIAIGIFEEDIFKLGEIVGQAKQNNRKIAVYGRTMLSILQNDMIHKNLNITSDDLMTIEEYMKSDNGVLIISGTGDVLYSKLAKIATGNDDIVEFSEKDLIILATPPAAGVEKRHAQILDELARTDAKLMALSDRNIWSMRASYEDIKMLISLLKPCYFIPIKALYKDFLVAEQAAIEAGVKQTNIVLADNGQQVSIKKTHIALKDRDVPIGDVYVDGIGIGDIGSVVLNERKILATDGVVIVGATIDQRNKEVVSLIDIQMRGVLYINEDNPIFKIIQKEVAQILTSGAEVFRKTPKKYDLNDLKKEIISKIKSEIKRTSGKVPMVLVAISEMDPNFNVKLALSKSQKSRNYVKKATQNLKFKAKKNNNPKK